MTARGSAQRGAGERLTAWYARHARDLPWRRRPDPYATWVSEIMLQQTTVAAAGPCFERFLSRFPDLRALAGAAEAEVLAVWSGLGYYHRARRLLRAARLVLDRHGGELPAERAELLALPGIGAYTAGAILSIGHNLPAAAVDGNAARVMARLGGIRGDPLRAAARRAIERRVLELMPPGQASCFNQALMDLGATVCLPRDPDCGRCPLRGACEARRKGLQSRIPPVRRRPAVVKVRLEALAVVRPGRGGRKETLLRRRPPGDILAGMWELPTAPAKERAGEAARMLARLAGARPPVRAGVLRHTITRHLLSIEVYRAEPDRPPVRPGAPRAGGRLEGLEPAPGAEAAGAARRLSGFTGALGATRWVCLREAGGGNSASLALTGATRKAARLVLGVEG